MTNFIIIGIIMFSWVVFGNLGIHLYFKKKREKVIENLNGINHKIANNIVTHISGKSRLNISYQRKKSDVVFYENNILILPYNATKLFKQYQPSLQYSFSKTENKIDGISTQIRIENLMQKENKIKLFHKGIGGILNGKMETELEFPLNETDLKELISKNKYAVQQWL
ncbi:hypothetical protein EYD45_16385 [Hyunsoonleella flava]|uniref:Uncharacterized protein n=1 Tax=Hyunsoonleella flava TaxID=2527939 RepID=A0A4Q9FAY5_9FLAO|nr:hypothetical protein [Hyunsoonleella flava]TBM98524.1 hypothetical protein EYD45_16385 [Hyunsoonleella flava]